MPYPYLQPSAAFQAVCTLTKEKYDSDLPVQLLEATAGRIGPDTAYRPYYVAAQLLGGDPRVIVEAEGVVWLSPTSAVRQMLALQQALDAAHEVSVPGGLEAILERLRPPSSGFVPNQPEY